ncbi:unnamed protein product [Diamesa serratosioi]
MVETNKCDSNSTTEIISNSLKRNGFHAKYLAVCKSKNLLPLPEVKVKQRNVHVLDFHCDRIKPQDWLSICNSLHNDGSLKFLAIRLRKNMDLVLEEIDNLKKTKSVTSRPVILTKYLFTELVDTLQQLLQHNSVLRTIICEGLPLTGKYMTSFSKGLANNHSIKTLSLTRSIIGDEGCEIVCSTLKHLPNIETLDLSYCNLSVKGAESISNLIKFQKIQRFSEGWKRSLRYTVIDPESIPGLRKLILNSNTRIGDEGVDLLVEVLKDDVWIKDVDLQNCGLGDNGANSVIKCLNLNKTIMNFNISRNLEISDHLYRHIIIQLGSVDQDNSDSTDSKSGSEKLNSQQIKEKNKFLEEQLESEVFRRKQMEKLNGQLHEQILDCQKEINFQGSFRIPDGYTLVTNETLDKMLKEFVIHIQDHTNIFFQLNFLFRSVELQKNELQTRMLRRRKNKKIMMTKVKSCTNVKVKKIDNYKLSKSECFIRPETAASTAVTAAKKNTKPFVEHNVGDCIPERTNAKKDVPLDGAEMLKLFVKNKKEMKQHSDNHQQNQHHAVIPHGFDPRSLFMGSSKLVPNNSDAESETSSH